MTNPKSMRRTSEIFTVAAPAATRNPKKAGAVLDVTGKVTSKTPAKKAPKASPQATTTDSADAPKPKLVRDSFTIPKSEYTMLDALKLRAANLARPTKKSEVLRAGIAALSVMSDKAFLAALSAVPSLKTGRPKRVASVPTVK